MDRARVAISLIFLTNGAIFANMVPRFPRIKAELDLTNAQFGLAIAAFPAGALLAGLTAGVLIRRFRSSRVAVAGTALIGVGVLLAGLAPTWAALCTALFFAGACDAVTDVAQNSHGLRLQRLYRRSILNSLHAVWSVGAVLGGLMGVAAAGLDLDLGVHLGISAAIFTGVAAGCYRFLIPGPEPTDTEERRVGGKHAAGSTRRVATYATLLALVLIALGGALVEDAGSSWAAIYLSTDLGAPVALAGFGYVALIGAQFVGRVFGDRLVDRFGQRSIARGGGVLVALGMGAALAFPSVPATIGGFALAGFGVATLVPAAMHEADELPGLRRGTGLAVVSWLMRVGFLLSPPVVGLVADEAGLRAGLLVVPLAGLLVVALSGALTNRRRGTKKVASGGTADERVA